MFITIVVAVVFSIIITIIDHINLCFIIYIVAETENASKKRKKTKAKQWNGDEKMIVHEFFAEHIKKGILPKKEECLRFMDCNKNTIQDTQWTTIKDCEKFYGIEERVLSH